MSEWIEKTRVVSNFRELWTWLSGQRLDVILSILILVTGAWGFIELADNVIEGDTQALDEAVLRSLRSGEDSTQFAGPAWVRQAARDMTALGGAAVLFCVTIAAAGFLALMRDYAGAAFVLAATWGGQLVCLGLKHFLNRSRPEIVPHWDDVMTSSFPSGHSMMAAVVYLTLAVLLVNVVQGRRLKSYVIGLAVMATFLVGVSRVVLGVHYPTDVLAGWTAGLVWALFCGLSAAFFKRNREQIHLSSSEESG
jgi:undecaprenyl-diphosphatase